MWFGILTPGAHPSRATPTVDDVTVYGWTPRGRGRLDGPAFAVHGGLRVLRRELQPQDAGGCLPRCFVCRERGPVPDPVAARAEATGPEFGGVEDPLPPAHVIDAAAHDAARAVAGGDGVLLFVHLEELPDDGADPPLTEEALVVLPGVHIALVTPLLALPGILPIAENLLQGAGPLVCEGCGCVLPAGTRERDAVDRAARRAAARRTRARPRRGGRHAV